MKLSTFGALGLTVWLLMVPPPLGRDGVATNAPTSLWKQIGSYNSEQDCEDAAPVYADQVQNSQQNPGQSPPGPSTQPQSYQSYAQQMLAAQQARCFEQ